MNPGSCDLCGTDVPHRHMARGAGLHPDDRVSVCCNCMECDADCPARELDRAAVFIPAPFYSALLHGAEEFGGIGRFADYDGDFATMPLIQADKRLRGKPLSPIAIVRHLLGATEPDDHDPLRKATSAAFARIPCSDAVDAILTRQGRASDPYARVSFSDFAAELNLKPEAPARRTA